jgi:hypothetical protein
MQIEGREAFLGAGTFPSDARTTLVRIVEHLRLEDGKITTSTFVTDSAAFMAFLGRM